MFRLRNKNIYFSLSRDLGPELKCLLNHRWRRETWWWNKEVDDAITAKRQAFKAWKAGK